MADSPPLAGCHPGPLPVGPRTECKDSTSFPSWTISLLGRHSDNPGLLVRGDFDPGAMNLERLSRPAARSKGQFAYPQGALREHPPLPRDLDRRPELGSLVFGVDPLAG